MKQQITRTISLRSIFWIAVMVAMAMGTGKPAEASTIHCTINNNAGMIAPLQNELVSITGQFNYDTATKGIDNFDVTFTTTLEFNGASNDDSSPVLISGLGQPRIIFQGPGGYAIDLFLNDFGGDGAYDIRFIDANDTPNTGYTLLPVDAQHRPTITAPAVGEAPVPEPSTRVFVLTGGAALMLLSLLLRRRAKIRAVRAVGIASL